MKIPTPTNRKRSERRPETRREIPPDSAVILAVNFSRCTMLYGFKCIENAQQFKSDITPGAWKIKAVKAGPADTGQKLGELSALPKPAAPLPVN